MELSILFLLFQEEQDASKMFRVFERCINHGCKNVFRFFVHDITSLKFLKVSFLFLQRFYLKER